MGAVLLVSPHTAALEDLLSDEVGPAYQVASADAAWHQHLDAVADRASGAAASVPAALAVARDLGQSAPMPGSGRTAQLWELLATVASADLTVARVLEPHLDALAIREQAELVAATDSTWGVFAAEGPGVAVTATEGANGWQLSGTKPWCSLAGELDRALITAHTVVDGEPSRRLFEIDLRDPGVTVATGGWFARGLTDVRSESIDLDAVPASPVGDDGWYLTRAGFAWGGMGVAAVWHGATVALARTLATKLASREPDQIGLMLLGEVDVLLHASRAVLASAADDVDAGIGDPALLAQRVRSTVSSAAERVTAIVGHALGPAPLAMDEEHARRVADLALYVRQDHAERDLARLGGMVLDQGIPPW